MSNELSYQEYRQAIKNGDVLLYRGTGLYARVIRHFFESPYTHAGVAVWWNNRLMVMEAVKKGVIVTTMSENLGRHGGGVDYFQCEVELAEHQRAKMVDFAQMQLGKEYNIWALLASGLRVVFRLPLKDKDGSFKHAAGKYFCSQYVSDIYDQAGIDLDIDLSSTRTSPDAIAKSPLLRFNGVIKRDG